MSSNVKPIQVKGANEEVNKEELNRTRISEWNGIEQVRRNERRNIKSMRHIEIISKHETA